MQKRNKYTMRAAIRRPPVVEQEYLLRYGNKRWKRKDKGPRESEGWTAGTRRKQRGTGRPGQNAQGTAGKTYGLDQISEARARTQSITSPNKSRHG